MKIAKNYQKPLIIAAVLHVVLLSVLIFNFAPSVFRAPPSSALIKTIQAKAISASAVQATVQKINEQHALMEHEAKMRQQKIVEQKQALQREKIAILKIQQAKIAAQKAAEKKLAIAKAQKARQEKLAQAAKQKKIATAKALKAAKAKKLLAQQKKLQKEMIQRQINSEAKNISQIQAQAQQQGKIDKYKAEILALIQSNWRIDQVNDKLKCVYDVFVAPDGTVISATLKQSSGNSNLDESAHQAIMASSPLPVPQTPALFNHFRQLVLTLSPQGILQSVGTA
ncbi:MAG: protein TolA [Gammaproteobacteria bacterium CG_4_10_14_0_8_um_filter_38_16]|nr:MAG: protein TolA [Gammaproteobacteria bacterium CG_4_10_14_0_8_um_filter_38_16]PJA03650.1 MAG: protein TolA [Gammaproteobacteria bacterium CG_4_10_14_0_2_um_filter_38_22]PJB11316.1 MAG: protein TolA [Gammaproteobacteria bacterium CG_4_9_14_3_um_filter_38_9]